MADEKPEVKDDNGATMDNGNADHNAEKFHSYVDETLKKNKDKIKRAAIFMHRTPDIDAMGSAMAIKWLLNKTYNVTSDIFCDGEISHPQNNAMMQALNPNFLEVKEFEKKDYHLHILVDASPQGKPGVDCLEITFNIVIDHHKDVPIGYEGIAIHEHMGSCCSLVYSLIEAHNIGFAKSDTDHRVATALLAGIITDTDNLMSIDTVKYDSYVHYSLFPFQDTEALRSIVCYSVPNSWMRLKGIAINQCENGGVKDGVAVIGLGILNDEQRDVVTYVADQLLRYSVQTVVVFALFDGSRVDAAIRTKDRSLPISAYAKSLAGKHGTGGARGNKGGYYKTMGSMEIEPDMDDELKTEIWEVVKKKEIARIFKTINK